VVPTIVKTTSAALNELMNDVVLKQLTQAMSSEMRTILEDSVSRTVQQPEVINAISDAVSKKLADAVSKRLTDAVSKRLETDISKVQSDVTLLLESTARIEKTGQEMKEQSEASNFKADQQTSLVRGLSDIVASMAAAQTGFQTEILRLNRRLTSRQFEEESRRVSEAQQPQSQPQQQQPQQAGYLTTPSAVVPPRTAEEIELADIAQLMHEGRFEEGSVKWLQSSQQADLFDNLFVRLNPTYLNTLSPIVSLSVGVAVTSSLQTHVSERLAWLEVVLQTVNLMDPDIREVAPKIMDILIQRLDGLYMSTAENDPQDRILRKIPPLSRRARALRTP
jgi:hypothetical protein